VSDRETPRRSPVRAIFDWLKGSPSADARPIATVRTGGRRELPARLGHYTLERVLGQGGMGVVYAARDEKLHRMVALKTMSGVATDEAARQRFWREARAAASVNHQNVCQIYEVGEHEGEPFIVMELLDGVPLSERLKQGPMSVADTVAVGSQMLTGLAALHQRGIVHRDLKPSNILLTVAPLRSPGSVENGVTVKLVDFGLARPAIGADHDTAPALTSEGAVIGTPHYMSPEQALGRSVDHTSDLFAAGAILFEMLAGRPAFTGPSVIAILHATVYEDPPALSGSPTVAAVDRVIRRALQKAPAERPSSAEAMADELRDVRLVEADAAVVPRPLTRIIVLPFRSLRPDPETDFLAFSLPDAITSSLAGVASIIVRSSAVAARYAGDAPDFKTLAAEAGVDRAVTGTLLRSGDELRVAAQLVETPAGTVIASHTVQTPIGDLFRLQDDIVRRVVETLALPIGASPASAPDLPHNARAYELYLRGNEFARRYDSMPQARDLYERAVALDAGFAPAWARLGRAYRVIGKYLERSPGSEQRAEDAYRRALELNPRLTIAHKYYAALEADTGRGEQAMVRLIGEATRHGNDPELFAGLVHACRYCGLLEESVAAHAEARRLDPTVATTYIGTLLVMGELDKLLAIAEADPGEVADNALHVTALGLAGRIDEARATLVRLAGVPRSPAFTRRLGHLTAWLDRNVAGMSQTPVDIDAHPLLADAEALLEGGILLSDVGEPARALPYLERALARGYYAVAAVAHLPQLDALRGDPRFQALVADAEAGRARARSAFVAAGGDRLLGR
jgi:serine/threonine protein kinase/tetratricopeptide (TPR) repeat protein